jgi:hypothetical protein
MEQPVLVGNSENDCFCPFRLANHSTHKNCLIIFDIAAVDAEFVRFSSDGCERVDEL